MMQLLDQQEVEKDEGDLLRSDASSFLGVASVSLNSFNLRPSRPIVRKSVERLKKIFLQHGCRRLDQKNHVIALIDDARFDLAVKNARMSREQFGHAYLDGNYPQLQFPADYKILCVHGIHRLAAGLEYLGPHDQWWTVRLYKTDITRNLDIKFSEEYENSTSYCDGEVYRRIRTYQLSDNKLLEGKWWARLSASKERGLRQVLGHERLVQAFDRLLEFPGLWAPLTLGNFQRLLIIRCDEEIIHFLMCIYEAWDRITCHDPTLRAAVDNMTAEKLQLRVPALGLADERYVLAELDCNGLFPTISDMTLRNRVREALLNFRAMIPSIEVLFKNLGYLELCAKILKNELLDSTPRSTLREAICACYSGDPATAWVEKREGIFSKYTPQDLVQAQLIAYKQLWLYCMRHFKHLGSSTPRKENGQAVPIVEESNPIYVFKLAKLADKLGIRNRKVEKLLQKNPDTENTRHFICRARPLTFYQISQSEIDKQVQKISSMLDIPEHHGDSNALNIPRVTSECGESIERRCGRPFENSYQADREFLFLNNFINWERVKGEGITSFFVRLMFFEMFFGCQAPLNFEVEDQSMPSPGNSLTDHAEDQPMASPENSPTDNEVPQPGNQMELIPSYTTRTDMQDWMYSEEEYQQEVPEFIEVASLNGGPNQSAVALPNSWENMSIMPSQSTMALQSNQLVVLPQNQISAKQDSNGLAAVHQDSQSSRISVRKFENNKPSDTYTASLDEVMEATRRNEYSIGTARGATLSNDRMDDFRTTLARDEAQVVWLVRTPEQNNWKHRIDQGIDEDEL